VKSSPDGDEKMIVAKWLSVLEHVTNKHEGFEYPEFPRCQHGPIAEREWLSPDSMAFIQLEKIMTVKLLLKDVGKLSRGVQTSSLESFHSVILKFIPKHTAFSYTGMQARNALAVMHWNANAGRLQAQAKSGRLRYSVDYPKAKKGDPSVKIMKTPTSYEYAHKLVDGLMKAIQEDREQLRELPNPRPPVGPLCDEYERKPKEEVIAALRTHARFAY